MRSESREETFLLAVMDTCMESTLNMCHVQPPGCITRNRDGPPDSRMQTNLEGFAEEEVTKLKMCRKEKGEPDRGTACAKTRRVGLQTLLLGLK